jgi:NADP-dependent 3-hydroxy acid dehydrogenase YdfG
MPGIQDKVVAVTGASSGIGEATALALAERGAKVALCARHLERLQAIAGPIAAGGGKVAYARADVRRRDDLTGLVELACKRFGRLDAIVANAGIGPLSLLEELRVENWEEMIDVNIKGVLYGIAAALPIFRKQGCGHFVHIASTAALKIVPTMAVYSATKTAVRHRRAIAPGSGRQAAGHDRHARIRVHGLRGVGDGPTSEGAAHCVARRFALEQPSEVDVNEIVICPTAQK